MCCVFYLIACLLFVLVLTFTFSSQLFFLLLSSVLIPFPFYCTEIVDQISPDYLVFRSALTTVAQQLSKKLVLDGEGATKFVAVTVKVHPFFDHYACVCGCV